MDALAVVSERSRRAILASLGALGEASVSALAAPMSITRPAVSQHLKVLREAGVVTERKVGRERLYRIDPGGIANVRAAITSFLVGELDDLERAATQTTVTQRTMNMEPVIIERLIDAGPEEAFALVTQPERLRRWQVVSADIDLRVGGSYRYTVTPGNIAGGEITEIDPGKRFAITWGWEHSDTVPPGSSSVVIDLLPQDGKTLVRFTHSGLSETDAAAHAEGWNHFGDRLVSAASGDVQIDAWSEGPEEFDLLSAAETSWVHCSAIVRNFTTADRETQTPCAEYTVHELVEHLMHSLRGLAGSAGGEVPEEIAATSAEDYLAQAAEICLVAWRDRGLEGEVPFPPGPVPAAMAAGVMSLEFFVHAWDFAQATGQDFAPAPHLTAFVSEIAHNTIQPEFRGVGRGFAQIEDSPSGDPLLDLMAFTGRSVT